MKLNEINKIISQNVHGIDLEHVKNFKIIKQNYLTDYFIESGSVGDQLVFVVCKSEDQSKVAVLVAEIITDLKIDSQKTVIMIKRTWCKRELRGHGLVSNLYRFLYNQLGYALISDVEQTPETIRLWDKLRTSWNIKMLDLKTKKISDIDTTELYGNSSKVLLVENTNLGPRGILNDYIFGLGED